MTPDISSGNRLKDADYIMFYIVNCLKPNKGYTYTRNSFVYSDFKIPNFYRT